MTMTAGFQLSPQQKRLWLLQRHRQIFDNRFCVRIEGRLAPRQFVRAIEDVIARHEILRTSYRSVDGVLFPLQVVSATGSAPCEFFDLSQLSPETRESRIAGLLQPRNLTEKELGRESLLQLSLARVSEIEHYLVLHVPALSFDAASLKIFLRESDRAYTFRLMDEFPSAESEAPLQYAQFAEWQNEILDQPHAEGKEFWAKYHTLPGDQAWIPFQREVPCESDAESASLSLSLDRERAAVLRKLAEHRGVSVQTLLLTCWLVLLFRLTNVAETFVGYVDDGRAYEELGDAIGLYVKALPFHQRLKDRLKFTELLKQICGLEAQLREWQDYFIMGATGESFDAEQVPAFSTGFQYISGVFGPASESGLRFSVQRLDWHPEPFKLSLCCTDLAESLILGVQYAPAWLSDEDAQRVADSLDLLLRSVAANDSLCIGEYAILNEAELNRVLRSFNRKRVAFESATLVELFEEQTARTPEALAVVHEDERLTYRELNNCANRLARHLVDQCAVRPEEIVGIKCQRSVQEIIGLIGILKAGAAYLPLGNSYPEERLAHILHDASCSALLTDEVSTQGEIPGLPERVVNLTSLLAESIPDTEAPNLRLHLSSRHLAYVIYTSGSTGKPKGVMIEHGAAANLVSALAHDIYQHQGEAMRVALVASCVFDASVQQIFGALLQGHSLWIVPDEAKRDGGRLNAFLNEHAINICDCTPTHFSMMLESGLAELDALCVKHFIIGGEVLPVRAVQRYYQGGSGRAQLTNIYGPTECCVDSTSQLLDAKLSEVARSIPIGKPLPNVQVYVLNNSLQPQPVGVPGEICISGSGLARGYLNNPSLTARSFVPNPFTAGERLYRTGDVGRWLPTGTLEILGRNDLQVKVRGYRIELGEIEATLLQHPSIREVAVLLHQKDEQDSQLIAYTVSKSDLTPSHLRDWLARRLPEYMLPGMFIPVNALPINENGKLDREALNNLAASGGHARPEYEPPRNDLEREVVALWEKVLGREQVGITDSLFDLGGHSLLALKLVSMMSSQLGRNLQLRSLYQNPTIKQLCERVINSSIGGDEWIMPLDEIKPGLANLFLLPPVVGSPTVLRGLAHALKGTCNVYGLQYRGFDRHEAFDESIEEMAERLMLEIQRVQRYSPFILAGYSMGGIVAFEIAKRLEQDGFEVKLVLLDRNVPAANEEPIRNTAQGLDRAQHLLHRWLPGLQDDEARRLVRLVDHNMKMVSAYRLSGKIKGNLVALEAGGNVVRTRMEEWQQYTSGQFTHHILSGDHYTILDRQPLAIITEILSNVLSGPVVV